jgi:hypothetical protein
VSVGVYVGGEYVWVGGEYEWLGDDGVYECEGVLLDFHDPPPIRPPVPGFAAAVTPKLAITTSTRAASDLTAAS